MSSLRLLVLQNCKCGGRTFFTLLRDHIEEHSGLEVLCLDGRHLPAVLPPFDGAVLAGSNHDVPDSPVLVGANTRILETAAARGKPVLAICFGFQVMVRWLTGRDPVLLYPCDGIVAVKNRSFPLLPPAFWARVKHKYYYPDLEEDLPPGVEVVGTTEDSTQRVQMLRLRHLRFVGTAFHPEGLADTSAILECFYRSVEEAAAAKNT